MQAQRQSQVQRSPTERFVDILADVFANEGVLLSDKQRVRLEDAFNDAVKERAETVLDSRTVWY